MKSFSYSMRYVRTYVEQHSTYFVWSYGTVRYIRFTHTIRSNWRSMYSTVPVVKNCLSSIHRRKWSISNQILLSNLITLSWNASSTTNQIRYKIDESCILYPTLPYRYPTESTIKFHLRVFVERFFHTRETA